MNNAMTYPHNQQGSSLIELFTVLAISSLLLGIGVMNVTALEGNARNTASELASYFRQARARAMSTTSAVRVRPESQNSIVMESAVDCSAETFTTLGTPMTLSRISVMPDSDWLVCYNSRGIADDSPVVQFYDTRGTSSSVEVFLGGSARVIAPDISWMYE